MNRIFTAVSALIIGFVLVVGGEYAYAAAILPNTGGGGGSGVSEATGNTLWCQLVGCTMTGATTYSGVSNDITTGANEALRLRPNGSGNLLVQPGGSTIFETSAGATALTLTTSNAGTGILSSAGGAAVQFNSTGLARTGITSDAGATGFVHCAADSITETAGTALACTLGEGKFAIMRTQTCTCVANAGAGGTLGGVTCDPTSSLTYISNPDADGCIVTLSEASAQTGARTTFMVAVSAGGVVTFPDVAGVHDGPTCATTTGLGLGDSYETIYAATLNAYQGVGSCTDN